MIMIIPLRLRIPVIETVTAVEAHAVVNKDVQSAEVLCGDD